MSSVPISLYRELCTELRHKDAELDAAEQQTQRLLQQNQQLRQELHQLVQRVIQTQQAVTQLTTDPMTDPTNTARSAAPLPARPTHRRIMRSAQAQPIPMDPIDTPLSQPQTQFQPTSSVVEPDHSSHQPTDWITDAPTPLTTRLWHHTNTFTQELQGWKLAVMMGLIVVSAFGAGFLIVRPFMARQSQNQQLQPTQPQQPQQPKR
jgi:hypothetical protein